MCEGSATVTNNCSKIEESINLINKNYTAKVMDIVNQQANLFQNEAISSQNEENGGSIGTQSLSKLLEAHHKCANNSEKRQFYEI